MNKPNGNVANRNKNVKCHLSRKMGYRMIDCFELEKNKVRRPTGWKSIRDEADVAAAGVENSEFTLMCWDCDDDVCGGYGNYSGEMGCSNLMKKVMFEKLIAVNCAGRNDEMRFDDENFWGKWPRTNLT